MSDLISTVISSQVTTRGTHVASGRASWPLVFGRAASGGRCGIRFWSSTSGDDLDDVSLGDQSGSRPAHTETRERRKLGAWLKGGLVNALPFFAERKDGVLSASNRV